MVTEKVQVAVLPEASVAVIVTVVIPTGKLVPDEGIETTVVPGQLSVIVGVNVTTRPQVPAVLGCVILAGQMMTGGCVSFTVTVNEQVAVFPAASAAVYVTVVTPTLNVRAPRLLIPVAGELAIVAPVIDHCSLVILQLSAVTGFVVAIGDEQSPEELLEVRLEGQLIVGGWLSLSTMTVLVHTLVHPLAVAVVVNVNEPAAPAVTLIDGPVFDPMMVPFPLMIVAKLAPGELLVIVKMFPEDPAQTEPAPVIVQFDAGFTATVFVQTLVHPLAVAVVVRVNEPTAPAVTLSDGPVFDTIMVPFPLMIVLKVAPGVLLVIV